MTNGNCTEVLEVEVTKHLTKVLSYFHLWFFSFTFQAVDKQSINSLRSGVYLSLLSSDTGLTAYPWSHTQDPCQQEGLSP